MDIEFTFLLILGAFSSCMATWECKYVNYGTGVSKSVYCSTGCCEQDCCPFNWIAFGIVCGCITLFLALVLGLVICCRRRRLAQAGVVLLRPIANIPQSVPEHHGYDQ